jgi:hypothetical protein
MPNEKENPQKNARQSIYKNDQIKRRKPTEKEGEISIIHIKMPIPGKEKPTVENAQ